MAKIVTVYVVLLVMVLLSNFALAANDSEIIVNQLQKRWAEVNYQLRGKPQRVAFKQLLGDVDVALEQHAGDAPVLIWCGIIKSSYAGVKGGLGALKYARASKADLEKAIELDAEALNGSAYTSLGTLYFKVPGWPLGFGDNKKAEALLTRALEINPDGIDPNYFYAEYLRQAGEYTKAEKYLLKAQLAQARPDRPVADQGRQKEIMLALSEVQKKLR